MSCTEWLWFSHKSKKGQKSEGPEIKSARNRQRNLWPNLFQLACNKKLCDKKHKVKQVIAARRPEKIWSYPGFWMWLSFLLLLWTSPSPSSWIEWWNLSTKPLLATCKSNLGLFPISVEKTQGGWEDSIFCSFTLLLKILEKSMLKP